MSSAVSAPMAAPAGIPVEWWPSKAEMEQWLHSAAMDVDGGAVSLRKLVQSHPGYGGYLADDEEIHGLVVGYARRLKKRISEVGISIQPEGLYRLLCEVLWKGVGVILDSLEPAGKASNVSWPLPREVRGQLKMLLQANEDLSSQLKELRRDYLRELSCHRDRHRRVGDKVQFALNSLIEEPIMFYEPLNSLLDDTTKDFVKMVIEERMKLEMKAEPTVDVSHEDELANSLAEADAQCEKLHQEVKKQRNLAAKEAEARKRAEEQLARWKAEAMEAKRLMNEGIAASEDAKKRLQETRRESMERERQLASQVAVAAPSESTDMSAFAEATKRQLKERDAVVLELQQELERLRSEGYERELEMQNALEKANALEADVQQLQKQLGSVSQAKPERKAAAPAPARPKGARDEEDTVVRVTSVKEVQVVEKIVVDEKALEEAKQELERHMQVEETLRKANKELEKALADAERRVTKAERKAAGEANLKASVTNVASAEVDVESAIANITAVHEKEINALEDELARLRDELEEARAGSVNVGTGEADPVKKKPRPKKPKPEEGESTTELMAKYTELERQYEDLMAEKDLVDQKVQGLLAKLSGYMSGDELKEALQEIDLEPPPPRRKRKKNAFERLYSDAMRRIVDLRLRRESLEKAQEDAIKAAIPKVKTKSQLQRLSALASLQRSAKATNDRFHEAMSNFCGDGRMPSVPEGDEAEASTATANTSADFQGAVSPTAAAVAMSPAVGAAGRLRCQRCGALVSFDIGSGVGSGAGMPTAAVPQWWTHEQPLISFALTEQRWGTGFEKGRSGERFTALSRSEESLVPAVQRLAARSDSFTSQANSSARSMLQSLHAEAVCKGLADLNEVTPLQGHQMVLSPRSRHAAAEDTDGPGERGRLGAEDEQMSLTPKRTAQTFSAVVGADAVAPHAPLTRPRARQAPLSPRPAARAAEELEGAPAPPPGPPPGQHARGMKKSESLPSLGSSAPIAPMGHVNKVWELPKKPGAKHKQRSQAMPAPRPKSPKSPAFLSVIKGQEMQLLG